MTGDKKGILIALPETIAHLSKRFLTEYVFFPARVACFGKGFKHLAILRKALEGSTSSISSEGRLRKVIARRWVCR